MIIICTEKERKLLMERCRSTECENCVMYNADNCTIYDGEDILSVRVRDGVIHEDN